MGATAQKSIRYKITSMFKVKPPTKAAPISENVNSWIVDVGILRYVQSGCGKGSREKSSSNSNLIKIADDIEGHMFPVP